VSSTPAASPAPTTSAAPAGAEPPPPDDVRAMLLEREEHSFRKTPEAVTRELEHMEKSYAPLPRLERLPDFLSVDDVLALHPEAAARESLREQIHQQFSGAGEALSGSFLDDDQRVFVLWISDGTLTQVLATFEGGKLVGRAAISRGQAKLGHVLAESDDERAEILVEHITSMSACCYPKSLSVYRVGRRGALSKVLSFEKSHSEVGPGVRWDFMNHFEFGAGRVVIQRVHPEGGVSYEFVYDAGAGRYRPTPGTVRRLAADRATSRSVAAEDP
jgi:hypothetical protein